MKHKSCSILIAALSCFILQEVCAQNCFVSQFPQLYGGSMGDTVINGMDINPTSKDVREYSFFALTHYAQHKLLNFIDDFLWKNLRLWACILNKASKSFCLLHG